MSSLSCLSASRKQDAGNAFGLNGHTVVIGTVANKDELFFQYTMAEPDEITE